MQDVTVPEMQAEWIAQVQAACESLAYLRAADANAVIEGGLSRERWLFHMTRLRHAQSCLSDAADVGV